MERYTDHAVERMRERCIGPVLVNLVESLGIRIHDLGGETTYVLRDRKQRHQLARVLKRTANELKRASEKLECRDPVFIAVTNDGALKTAGHEHTRHFEGRRKRRRAT